MLYLAGASVFGFLAGVVAALCWQRVMPPGYNRGYWSMVRDRMRRLIGTPDDSEFLRLYKELLRSAASFLGRNLLALVFTVLPVALLVYLTLLPLERGAAKTAEFVEVHSAQPVAIADQVGLRPATTGRQRARLAAGSSLKLRVDGGTVELANLQAGTAICTGDWDCLAMALLGLDIAEAKDSKSRLATHVIIRPLFAHRNPLWPYLTDMSVAFYLALAIGAVLVPMVRAKRG